MNDNNLGVSLIFDNNNNYLAIVARVFSFSCSVFFLVICVFSRILSIYVEHYCGATFVFISNSVSVNEFNALRCWPSNGLIVISELLHISNQLRIKVNAVAFIYNFLPIFLLVIFSLLYIYATNCPVFRNETKTRFKLVGHFSFFSTISFIKANKWIYIIKSCYNMYIDNNVTVPSKSWIFVDL